LKTRTISGRKYLLYPDGILIPADLVSESIAKVRAPKDVVPLLQSEAHDTQENVIVFTLDGHNQIIKKHVVTRGLANSSQIHPRETFRPAFLDGAVSIIIAHNHPSGNLEPSENDIAATRRLVEVGKTMGIPLVDHLIVSKIGQETAVQFLSLRDRFPAYFS